MAKLPSDEKYLVSEVFFDGDKPAGAKREGMGAGDKRPHGGTWREDARDIPVWGQCDVLVVGGGPSGTAAAAAAARTGADVVLLERYNHLGGLSTGGLVIWIDRMTDWTGDTVIRGFAAELFERLPKDAIAGPGPEEWGSRDPARVAHWSMRTAAYHGIVTWSPTVDPERLKLASQELVLESKVRLLYHAWAARPIVSAGGTVCGVAFESKAGRQAVLAKVVVDATGDGDLFAQAGARCETDIEESDIHHCMNTSWLFGGVDMPRWIAFRSGTPQAYSAFMQRGRDAMRFFDKPFVSWRDDIALFMGPRQAGYSALDPDDQTTVEVRSHRLMALHLDFYRAHAPGFEHAYLLQSGPQLGVRHSRRLVGVSKVTRAQWPTGLVYEDEIGVSPSPSPKFPNISIPYGSLVPESLDGLLACGRHIACDPNSHGFLREIPQCWVTGQAAGAAAAIAANRNLAPRAIDVVELQAMLEKQGVFLRRAAVTA
jgi:hypothetical protein